MSSLARHSYDPRRGRRPIVVHTCGKKMRLGADEWGFCRDCREEFSGKGAQVVPAVPPLPTPPPRRRFARRRRSR